MPVILVLRRWMQQNPKFVNLSQKISNYSLFCVVYTLPVLCSHCDLSMLPTHDFSGVTLRVNVVRRPS